MKPRTQAETTLYVVCYDVCDDKRRAKVHSTLSGFGTWTQFSLFECYLTHQQLILLQARLAEVMNTREDTIRLYALCAGCRGRVQVLGRGDRPQEATSYIL